MISALSVQLDRGHYSRYEDGRSTIVATITATGTAGDQATVKLKRKAGAGEIDLASQTVTFSGSPIAPVSVSFDLTALKDADGFMLARSSERLNDYRVVAEAGAVKGESRFTVVPVTADEIKERYLMGLSLGMPEKLLPRLQPQAITGVTVKEVSPNHQPGAGLLTLTVSGSVKTLSWADGTAVTLSSTIAQYLLANTANGYLLVTVAYASLPGSSVSEMLYIEPSQMQDSVVISEVLQVLRSAESGVHVNLEPTLLITDLMLADQPSAAYDEIAQAAHYYKDEPNRYRWLSVKIPYNSLLKVYSLAGFFNKQKSVEFGSDWQVRIEKNGMVILVPSNAAILNANFLGIGLSSYLVSRMMLPNFYHFRVLAGLREIPAEMLSWIGKRATMTVLATIGLARNPTGATSLSLSRDGVSESRGLNPKGLYEGIIARYEQETGRINGQEMFLAQFQQEHVGLEFTTL